MKNPWVSLWLSAANTATSTTRGFWMSEFRRQQKAMEREWARALRPAPKSSETPKRREK
jgi:hypothetical protein